MNISMRVKAATSVEQHGNTYLPSIDGLRAIAVLAVLLFHANVRWTQGGFLGVDAFFVISGFVISRTILTGLENRSFSYPGFLLRRYARLTPALLCVVILSLLAGIFLLSPRQVEELSQSGASAVLSVSNIYFFFKSGYFDGNADTKVLLHTWSLGVEEQFYLVWPLLLAGTYRMGGKFFAIAAIVAISLLSWISAALMASRAPDAIFYLTPFRIYQLGLGSALGLSGLAIANQRQASLAAFTGIGGLILSAILFSAHSSTVVAGTAAALATAMFILGATSPFATKTLGNRIMTGIGRRAYAIYLVHWPLIVLARDHMAAIPYSLRPIAIIVASLLIGDILHRYVETPLRLKPAIPVGTALRKAVFRYAGALHAALLVVTAILIYTQGFTFWKLPAASEVVALTRSERGEIVRLSDYGKCSISGPITQFEPDICLSVDTERSSVALLGDSFGIDTVVALRDSFGDRYHFAPASLAGCAPQMPGVEAPGTTQDCMTFNKLRVDRVLEKKFPTVVLAGSWNNLSIVGATELVRHLVSNGSRVHVVGVRAAFLRDVTDIVMTEDNIETANAVLKNYLIAELVPINATFSTMVENAGGDYIEVMADQCSVTCDATTPDGRLLYFDSSHFSHAGMDILGRRIVEHTGNAL